MNGLTELIDIAFAPLIISGSDLLLFNYLSGGRREQTKKGPWGLWFVLTLAALASTQYLLNGKTGQEGNIYVFYLIRFALLLIFSTRCTSANFAVRSYLIILLLLSTDICLITFARASIKQFGSDYLVMGALPQRVIAHALLIALKTGVIVLIKKQIQEQVFGIQSLYQAVIIILPALPYFFMRDYARLFDIRPIETPWSIHFITVLCGICALVNMIVSERLSYQIRQNEILRMERIIKKQHDQYMVTKNTIEAVNRKYHDLRHIIRGIDSMQDLEQIKGYMRNLEDEIKDYEAICSTGNRTLDVILSERMRLCKRKGIEMHVRVDGQHWQHIHDADLATIFGNALDNAVESVEKIEDSSKRLIDVRARLVNQMLIARFENPYVHVLERKQNRFVTTKHDKLNHGFGLQSIELTVKKYQGDMDIKTGGGTFILTVLIPADRQLGG